MPNDFRINGLKYVSGAGIPGNPGTKDLPLHTVPVFSGPNAGNAGVSSDFYIIGTGQYVVDNLGHLSGRSFIADGYVKFNAGVTKNFAYSHGSYPKMRNIHFQGYTGNVLRAGGNVLASYEFTDCIFEDCNFDTGAWIFNIFVDCIFINCRGSIAHVMAPNGTYTIRRCLFINSPMKIGPDAGTSGGNTLQDCYSDSAMIFPAAVVPYVQNCNLQGNPDLAGVNGNINADPMFNNKDLYDFTLRRNSPHLVKGIGPATLRMGNGFYLRGEPGDITANSGHYFESTTTNEQFPIYDTFNMVATMQNGQLRMKVKQFVGGPMVAYVKVAVRVSDVPIGITYNNFVTGLNFNTSYPAIESQFEANNPPALNNNVPDSENYVSGHAGRNPNRLTYRVRWSTKDEPKVTTVTDWITGNVRPIMEWKAVHKYNPVSLTGSGDPLFKLTPTDVADNPIDIVATWLDMEIVLTDKYFSR